MKDRTLENFKAYQDIAIGLPTFQEVWAQVIKDKTMSYILPETQRLGVRVFDRTPSFDATKKYPSQRGVYAVMLAGSQWNGWRAFSGVVWSPFVRVSIEEASKDLEAPIHGGVQSFDGVWSGLNETGYERILREQRLAFNKTEDENIERRLRIHPLSASRFGTPAQGKSDLVREFAERSGMKIIDFDSELDGLRNLWPGVSKAGKITTHLNKAAWHIKQATEIANEPPTS